MDYKKHYNLLIERAKTRTLTGYFERHHIVPKCLGGSNKEENIVALTPEEHYVAHQLLVMMYPGVDSLVYAANKMTVTSHTTQRNNKRYGWLKRRHQSVCKNRAQKHNPAYGKSWYYDPTTGKNGMFKAKNIPEGWIKGRCPRRPPKYTNCQICTKSTNRPGAKYCDSCRDAKHQAKTKKYWRKGTNFELLYALIERNQNGEQLENLAREYDKSVRAFYYDLKRVKNNTTR